MVASGDERLPDCISIFVIFLFHRFRFLAEHELRDLLNNKLAFAVLNCFRQNSCDAQRRVFVRREQQIFQNFVENVDFYRFCERASDYAVAFFDQRIDKVEKGEKRS